MEYFPVRCHNCNKVLGNKQEAYEELIQQGLDPETAMDSLEITRECCRTRVLTPEMYTETVIIANPSSNTFNRRLNGGLTPDQLLMTYVKETESLSRPPPIPIGKTEKDNDDLPRLYYVR